MTLSFRSLAPALPWLLAITMTQGQPLFEPGARVLFQGDSITDMARGRTADPNHLLGHSYVFLIAAHQGAMFPEQAVTFINRGVSGNELGNLAERWDSDTIALQPGVLSILVGVNDVGHALRKGEPVSIAKYEATYDQLLARTVAALPRVRLVLCEPFIAPGRSPGARYDEWLAAIRAMQAVVGKLAAKYRAPVVHFQRTFDAAFQRAPVEYWIWDGIHPTYVGHQLMADEWRRTYLDFYGPAARAD